MNPVFPDQQTNSSTPPTLGYITNKTDSSHCTNRNRFQSCISLS